MLLKQHREPLRLPTRELEPGTVIEFVETVGGAERGEQYWYTGETDGSHATFDGYTPQAPYSTRFTPSQLHRWLDDGKVRVLGTRAPPFPGARGNTSLPLRCRFKDFKSEVLRAQIEKGELPEEAEAILQGDGSVEQSEDFTSPEASPETPASR